MLVYQEALPLFRMGDGSILTRLIRDLEIVTTKSWMR
jgi:hypothetical protein